MEFNHVTKQPSSWPPGPSTRHRNREHCGLDQVLHLQPPPPQVLPRLPDLLLQLLRCCVTVVEGGDPVSHGGQREAAERHQQVEGHGPGHLPVRVREVQVQQVEADQSPQAPQQRRPEQPLHQFGHGGGSVTEWGVPPRRLPTTYGRETRDFIVFKGHQTA